MLARDPVIPVAERLPFTAVCRRPKDVALARQDEIGMNREFEVRQAGFEQLDGPARVDGPKNTFPLESFDMFQASRIEDRLTSVGYQGAVEIGAEKADFSGHRAVT